MGTDFTNYVRMAVNTSSSSNEGEGDSKTKEKKIRGGGLIHECIGIFMPFYVPSCRRSYFISFFSGLTNWYKWDVDLLGSIIVFSTINFVGIT